MGVGPTTGPKYTEFHELKLDDNDIKKMNECYNSIKTKSNDGNKVSLNTLLWYLNVEESVFLENFFTAINDSNEGKS